MQYGFRLEWEELPRELREEKIDEYIRFNQSEGDLITTEEALQDENIRYSAKRNISARFPIYF